MNVMASLVVPDCALILGCHGTPKVIDETPPSQALHHPIPNNPEHFRTLRTLLPTVIEIGIISPTQTKTSLKRSSKLLWHRQNIGMCPPGANPEQSRTIPNNPEHFRTSRTSAMLDSTLSKAAILPKTWIPSSNLSKTWIKSKTHETMLNFEQNQWIQSKNNKTTQKQRNRQQKTIGNQSQWKCNV